MSDKAWVVKAIREGPVLEDIDLGPLGDEDVEVAAGKARYRIVLDADF